jgi:hypothetical protein
VDTFPERTISTCTATDTRVLRSKSDTKPLVRPRHLLGCCQIHGRSMGDDRTTDDADARRDPLSVADDI